MHYWLPLLEETVEFLEQDLTEVLKLRKSKFNKSMAMRKAKMKFGKKKKSSSTLTVAQKKQRQAAAQASANSRSGKKITKRRIMWK